MKKLLFVSAAILSLSSCLTNYTGGEISQRERDELGSDPRVHIDTAVYQRAYVAFDTRKDDIYVYNERGNLIWKAGYCTHGDFPISIIGVMFLLVKGMIVGYSLHDEK